MLQEVRKERDVVGDVVVQVIREILSLLGASPNLIGEGSYSRIKGDPFGIYVRIRITRLGSSREEDVRNLIRQTLLSGFAEKDLLDYHVQWELQIPTKPSQPNPNN